MNLKFKKLDDTTLFEKSKPIKLITRADETDANNDMHWNFVGNSNYSSKHPLHSADGKVIGHLVGGVDNIGYTYEAVYLGAGSFLVAGIPWNTRTDSLLLVQPNGRFLFRPKLGIKFEVTSVHELGRDWVSGHQGIKMFTALNSLNDGIVFVSSSGIAVVSPNGSKLKAKIEFDRNITVNHSMAISPKRPLIAMTFSDWLGKDVLDNSDLWKNYINIYDLSEGKLIANLEVPGKDEQRFNIDFSSCGRLIQTQLNDESVTYALST